MAIAQISDGMAKFAFTSLHHGSLVSSQIPWPLREFKESLMSPNVEKSWEEAQVGTK